jgi:hypothetical protein
MIVLEVIAGVLVTALAIATVFAAVTGLLGAVGAVRFVRCSSCRRLGVTSRDEAMPTCVNCRHERLLHPVYQWHHVHAGAPRRVRHLG